MSKTKRFRTRALSGECFRSYYDPSLQKYVNTSFPYLGNEILEDFKPGSGACYHSKPSFLTGTLMVDDNFNARPRYDTFINAPISLSDLGVSTSVIPTILNWNKIPSSSQFGLIQFFAELDDTLAIFARKFWESLSYGSITWGLFPLISELKNLSSTLNQLKSDLANFPYEDQSSGVFERFSRPFIGGDYFNTRTLVRYKLRYSGSCDISFQDPISIMLDRLGFQPNMSTFWDIIPFSFVVDYILPIGDFLDGLQPSGWVQAARFTGWSTYKLEILKIERKLKSGSMYDTWQEIPFSGGSEFSRSNNDSILTVERQVQFEFEAPSFREMFNILYLLLQTRR